jgi:hypothetical protein
VSAATTLDFAPLLVLFAALGVAIASPHPGYGILLAAAGCDAVIAVVDALRGDWANFAVAAVDAGIWLWFWWRRDKRKRRRSLRRLGHKALAAIGGMLRNMPRPGPVLRPAPQGSPA